jgi:hypothetical protein
MASSTQSTRSRHTTATKIFFTVGSIGMSVVTNQSTNPMTAMIIMRAMKDMPRTSKKHAAQEVINHVKQVWHAVSCECCEADGSFQCGLCGNHTGFCMGAADNFEDLCDFCSCNCAACGKVLDDKDFTENYEEGTTNYSIHARSGMTGSEVPLCKKCGQGTKPSLETLWMMIEKRYPRMP